jgi:hypothetical protein
MLNSDQLQIAVAAAKCTFDLLAKKHPGLKARLPNGNSTSVLVFSSPSGHAGIDSSPTDLLSQFPAMLVDEAAKTSALSLQARLSALESEPATGSETKQLKAQLAQLASHLTYDGGCRVELRFNRLDYELIWNLQADEFVDRNLTHPTKASIRIVLATLTHLAQQ